VNALSAIVSMCPAASYPISLIAVNGWEVVKFSSVVASVILLLVRWVATSVFYIWSALAGSAKSLMSRSIKSVHPKEIDEILLLLSIMPNVALLDNLPSWSYTADDVVRV
jgi:hypothetical protein